jgi:hypothetical protein
MTASSPPGWYPDPYDSFTMRYWDGGQWTEHVAPRQGPVVPAWTPERAASADAETLRASARRARTALMVAIPINALNPLVQGALVRAARRAFEDVRVQIDDVERGQPGVEVQPYRDTTSISAFGNLTSLPTLVVGVLFVIWFHQAATTAVRLGRPARRSPGWAVGGWFIPIGNLFLPYQSGRDVFRPGDAAGPSTVLRWWVTYLLAGVATLPLAVLVGFRSGPAIALACTALALVVWLAAGLAAIAFVDSATADLAGEAEARGRGAVPGGIGEAR